MVHKRFDADGCESEVKMTEPLTRHERKPPTAPPSPVFKKRGRNARHRGKNQKKPNKSIKNNIRSIQRQLNNKGSEMAPNVRKVKEAELEELMRLKDEHSRRELERGRAQQYRMLKFFERNKLQRTLDNILKKGDKPEDAEQKKQIVRDLRYINEYPKDKKYIALFPTGGHTEQSKKRVEEMRAEIESENHAVGAENTLLLVAESRDQGHEAVQDSFFLTDDSD